jgi:hypothetical protein
MTYSGVFVIMLSGLEPTVAIALPCIPLTRPLFDRSIKTTHSSYGSRRISFFLKKGSRTQGFDPTATFSDRLAYRDIRIAKVISAEISAIVPFADWLG